MNILRHFIRSDNFSVNSYSKSWVAKYRANNPDKVAQWKANARAKYASDPEKDKMRSRMWQQNNSDWISDYAKKRYAADPEKYKERVRIWQKNNPYNKTFRINVNSRNYDFDRTRKRQVLSSQVRADPEFSARAKSLANMSDEELYSELQ